MRLQCLGKVFNGNYACILKTVSQDLFGQLKQGFAKLNDGHYGLCRSFPIKIK